MVRGRRQHLGADRLGRRQVAGLEEDGLGADLAGVAQDGTRLERPRLVRARSLARPGLAVAAVVRVAVDPDLHCQRSHADPSGVS